MTRETKEAKAARLAHEAEAAAARESAFRRGLPLRLLKLAARAEGLGVTVQLREHDQDVEVKLTFPPTPEAQERARQYSERVYYVEHSVSLASEEWNVERVEDDLDELSGRLREEENLRNRRAELLGTMSEFDKKALGLQSK